MSKPAVPPAPTPENISEAAALLDTPDRIPRPDSDYPNAVSHTPAVRAPDMAWVERSLAAMSLDQKIGQLLATSTPDIGEAQIDECHVGGFCFLGNGIRAADIVARVNALQAHSPFPLWFALDSEAGPGARVADATVFPMQMAFGAARDPALTELCGRITARESRALGLQAAYGPAVDVNTETRNPIICTRSFSDDPALVTELARGFIRGARAEGILCTLKHYPGHGASQGDSHRSLPTIDITIDDLMDRHLAPYAELVATDDVDMVMTAHLWFPCISRDIPWPATLSRLFNHDILRKRFGFDGLIISDAFDMVGLTLAAPKAQNRGVIGLEAGLDVILGAGPQDLAPMFRGIKNAVETNRISIERIDESVRRVLIAKSRAGLPEIARVDPEEWKRVLNHPDHRAVVQHVCERAFTEIKNEIASGGAAISKDDRVLVLSLAGQQRIFYRFGSHHFTQPFIERVPSARIMKVEATVSDESHQQILRDAAAFDKIVVLGYDWHSIANQSQVDLINALCDAPASVIYVSFGAPYHHAQIPNVDAFFCGYASVHDMQRVAVEVLLGDRIASGHSPV